MRKFTLGWVLSVAVLLPNVGTAQVYSRPNSYPQVTAANAAWQLRGDPVFHAGSYYYPTGPSVFFDGNLMVRTDTFQGVPVYEDGSREAYSVVFIPIGGNVVRTYERRRDGELAGTVGSRPPSFPIQRDGEVSLAAAQGGTGITYPRVNEYQPPALPETSGSIGTGGIVVKVNLPAEPAPAARRNVQTIMQLWVPFEGARWVNSGPAVSYDAARFTKVGDNGGFPIYREKNGRSDEIFIPSVTGGAVAPYKKAK